MQGAPASLRRAGSPASLSILCSRALPTLRQPRTLVKVLCDARSTHTGEPSFPAPMSLSQLQIQLPRLPAAAPQRITAQQGSRELHNLVPASSSGGGDPPSGGSGGDGGGGGGGGGGGEGGGAGEGRGEGSEQVLSLKEVEKLCQEQGVTLPKDMIEVASKFGLRASVLTSFLSNAKAGGLVGFITRNVPYLRDRLLADNLFLFKVGAEIAIDSGCATVAEVRKRGDDFWAEFEFYLSDLFVGLVLDVALVSLMAPAAVLGGASKAAMSAGWLAKLLSKVPSAVFEASIPGVKSFSLGARVACLGVKFLEYSLAGITCGLIGQSICNGVMNLKRSIHGAKEDDVAVPPLMKTALVWGLFMGLSSNIRYQIVFGLERLVDLTIAKKIPAVAYGTTVSIRFVNNVIGGENFIDMARWAGVQ